MGNEASQEGEDQGQGQGYGGAPGGQAAPGGFGPSSASAFGFGSMAQSAAPSGPGGGAMGMHSLPSSAPASRRSSGASIRSMPPMGSSPVAQPPSQAPDVDLSHLSEEERALIANVMARAQNLEMEPPHREPEPVVVKRPIPATVRQDITVKRACPMCHVNDVSPNASECADCRQRVCHECGAMMTSPSTKRPEWVCSSCARRRHQLQQQQQQQQQQRHMGAPSSTPQGRMGMQPNGARAMQGHGRGQPDYQDGGRMGQQGRPSHEMQGERQQKMDWGQEQSAASSSPYMRPEDGKLSEYPKTTTVTSTTGALHVDTVAQGGRVQSVAKARVSEPVTYSDDEEEEQASDDSDDNYDEEDDRDRQEEEEEEKRLEEDKQRELDEMKEQKNKENWTKSMEKANGGQTAPPMNGVQLQEHENVEVTHAQRSDDRQDGVEEQLDVEEEDEDEEEDETEEEDSEDDSDDGDTSPQILQPLPYYDHSPGEVYTIPEEEEEEVQSPTTQDGVTSLTRWRGGVIPTYPDSGSTKPKRSGDPPSNNGERVSQQPTREKNGQGTSESDGGRPRPYGVVRQQQSLEEVLGTAAKGSTQRSGQEAGPGQRGVSPGGSGQNARKLDVPSNGMRVGQDVMLAGNGRKLTESTSPDFASSGAGMAISNMISSASQQHQPQYPQQQGMQQAPQTQQIMVGGQQGQAQTVGQQKGSGGQASRTKPKTMDLQTQKKQKSKPDPQDWSPLTDLSPILDVSPSLEAAEQELMAKFQEENQDRSVSAPQQYQQMHYPQGAPQYAMNPNSQPQMAQAAAQRTASGTISGMLADFSKALGLGGSSPRPSPEERGPHQQQQQQLQQQQQHQQQQHIPQQQQNLPQQQHIQQQQPYPQQQQHFQQQQYPQQQQHPQQQQQYTQQQQFVQQQQHQPQQISQQVHHPQQQQQKQQQHQQGQQQQHIQQQQQHIQQQQQQHIQQQQHMQQQQFQQQQYPQKQQQQAQGQQHPGVMAGPPMQAGAPHGPQQRGVDGSQQMQNQQLQVQLHQQQQQLQMQKQQMQQMQQQLQKQQQMQQPQVQTSPKKVHRRLPYPSPDTPQGQQGVTTATSSGSPKAKPRLSVTNIAPGVTTVSNGRQAGYSQTGRREQEATVLVNNGAISKPSPAPRGLPFPTKVDGTPTSVTAFSHAHVAVAAKSMAAAAQEEAQPTDGTPYHVLESPVTPSRSQLQHMYIEGRQTMPSLTAGTADDSAKRSGTGMDMRGPSPPRPSSPSITIGTMMGTPGSGPQTPQSQRGGDSSDTQSEADSVKSSKVRRKLPPLPADQEPSPLPIRKAKARARTLEDLERARLGMTVRQSSLDRGYQSDRGTSSYADLVRPTSSASDTNLKGIMSRSNLNALKSISATNLAGSSTSLYDPSARHYHSTSGLYGTSSNPGLYGTSSMPGLYSSLSQPEIDRYGVQFPIYLRSLKQQLRSEFKSATEERIRFQDQKEQRDARLRRELVAAGLLPKDAKMLPTRKPGALLPGQALYASHSQLPSSRLAQSPSRKGRHRRQLSDSKIPAFSPIKEDKDFESELGLRSFYKSFEYESIDDALRAEGLLGAMDPQRPSTALGTFSDSGAMGYPRGPELRDTVIGDYPSGYLRRTGGSSSDWYLARRSSEGRLVGLEQLGRSSSQEGLYWTDGRHGRHYYIPHHGAGSSSHREHRSGREHKPRKPRSWHPSPYVSEDEDDQLTREEKKQKIKAEIARRRRQIEENSKLHDELLRLARAREHATAKLHATAAAAAAMPLSQADLVGVPGYSSSYELDRADQRHYPPSAARPIDQSRSMPSISSQAEFREAGSVLKSIDEILRYDNYGKPTYEVYGEIFGKAPHASQRQPPRSAYGHYDRGRHYQAYEGRRGPHPPLRYSLSAEDESINRIASTFRPEYDYPSASYYEYADYSPITTDIDTPPDFTPAMPLLPDMPSRSRKLLEHLGSTPITDAMMAAQSRPVLYRSRSEYDSRQASDPYCSGGIPLDQRYAEAARSGQGHYSSRPHSALPSTSSSSRTVHEPNPGRRGPQYNFPVKRILLTRDPKDRSISGNGLGMKVVGGKAIPGSNGLIGAYVAKIYPGGVVDTLSEVKKGDQVLEWNGIPLTGKTYEDVQKIVAQSNGEIEIVIRSDINMMNGSSGKSAAPAKPPRKNHPNNHPSPHNSPNSKRSNHNNNPNPPNHNNNNNTVNTLVSHQQSKKHPNGHAYNDNYQSLPQSHSFSSSNRNINMASQPSPSSVQYSSSYDRRFDNSENKQPADMYPDNSHHYQRYDAEDEGVVVPAPRSRRNLALGGLAGSNPSASIISPNHSQTNSPSLPTPQSFASSSPKQDRPMNHVKVMGNIKQDKFLGEMQLQVCYDIKAQILYVTIIQARNLNSTRDAEEARPDPFVKCYLLPGRNVENQRRTRYFSHSSNPEWKQTMVYPNISPEELQKRYLEITVWSYDIYRPNEFLGEVLLDLSDESTFDEEARWHRLQEHRDYQSRNMLEKTKHPASLAIHTHSSDTSLSSMAAAANNIHWKGVRATHPPNATNKMLTSLSNEDFHKINVGEHKPKKFNDAQGRGQHLPNDYALNTSEFEKSSNV